MRAVAARSGELRLVDVDRPEPVEGEALVRVLACGICGSDLHFMQFGEEMMRASRESGNAQFAPDFSRDIIMGHEFCCEVVAYGPNTTGPVGIGDRITSVPSRGAYSNTYPGGYSEYMVLDAGMLLPVQDSVPTEHAATTEPMAVGLHAVRAARLTAGEPTVVYGCGPVGLATIASLRNEGAGTIIASDFSPRRRELAGILGADVVVDPRETPPIAALQEQGYQPGQDVVLFDAIGVRGTISMLMREAPQRGARCVIVGVCMQEDTIVPMAGIEKEIQLKFVLGYTPEEFAETLANITDGSIDSDPIITGRVGLDGVAEAFQTLGDPEEHCKIMVTPHEQHALSAKR